jgi:hypothetical protein
VFTNIPGINEKILVVATLPFGFLILIAAIISPNVE